MKVLLDTHAFLWAITDDPQLSERARNILESGRNELFVSVVSLWEILVKVQIAKLPLPRPVGRYLQQQLATATMQVLPVTFSHVLQLEQLPLHHRDPFDRFLVAQSIDEDLAILTADPALKSYPAKLIW
jgi:PIN domain nuclease of toxin-antitoxin system